MHGMAVLVVTYRSTTVADDAGKYLGYFPGLRASVRQMNRRGRFHVCIAVAYDNNTEGVFGFVSFF